MELNKLIWKIKRWEVVCLIISFLLLLIIMSLDFFYRHFYENYPLTSSSLIGLASCVITAIGILVLERGYRNKRLFDYYSKIAGRYVRTDIGQDNTAIDKLKALKDDNIGLYINITYEGENKFNADMEYWKSHNAKAKGFFEFRESNKLIASGTYKYYEGGPRFKDHFGTLELFRFEETPKKIYVKYQHIFPREPPQSPDNNRGWQVWEQI